MIFSTCDASANSVAARRHGTQSPPLGQLAGGGAAVAETLQRHDAIARLMDFFILPPCRALRFYGFFKSNAAEFMQ